MGNLLGISRFKLFFYIGCGAVLVLAVIFLALGGQGGGNETNDVRVSVWGTVDENTISRMNNNEGGKPNYFANVGYTQVSEDTLYNTLLEAVATGKSPDALIVPYEMLYSLRGKTIPIPFANFPERQFRDTFFPGAEQLVTVNGIEGIPLFIDPLVMYYNRSILDQALIPAPPQRWSEFYALSRSLTEKVNSLTVTQSTVPFGEANNVFNFKYILSSLFTQLGFPVGKYAATEDKIGIKSNESPAASALNFYLEFSNPSKDVYTWNRSLPESKDMFVSGDLVFYFGLASEYKDIQSKNPNLDFDVAFVPQTDNAQFNATYGKMYVLVIPRSSGHPAEALAAGLTWSGATASAGRAADKMFSYQPVRRDILSVSPTDALGPVFYSSAYYSRDWLDPNPRQSSIILTDMISDITSGRYTVSASISRAGDRIDNLYGN
ncbi:MAG TPA: extracellular solute-binding protein [Candidatus Paceibacterota bacterium]|nr:extracellular solute-binding protein [Candidatus Paceibacterota bacterium]